MKEIFISNSPLQTEKIAEDLVKNFSGGETVAFTGNLGYGKTCFVRGMAKGLGFNGDVTSPTFAIINEYVGGRLPLYHFDMYRVTSWVDLYSTGFFEYQEQGGVTAVEWSENIAAAIPENAIYVNIEQIGETSRKITIESSDSV